MSREQAPVFRLVDLRKIYGQGDAAVHALRGVDLTVAEGELLVLLGPSGSGKSTLLNILGGLDVPTSGEVVYNDRSLTKADEAALTAYRRTHVGFVFQFYNLIPSLTTRENVALVTELVERPMAPEAALAMVGLDHRLDHFPSQLSGGEQQRVAIARALVGAPRLLLADEPTGNLDPKTSEVIWDLFLRLQAERGLAVVIATHNHELARRADRGYRLVEGRAQAWP
jgi:putative ABC transport system ATP-binding protein